MITTFQAAFTIAGRPVGAGHPCFVIAEAGVSHFGSLDKARRLVDMAVQAGADAVKFQHYRTDDMIGPAAPEWRDRMRTRELTDDQMRQIRDMCDAAGILFLCTGHDEASIDFLDRELDVAAFKVGSGELRNWPSLDALARRGKPIILSTGMYEMADIEAAVRVVAAAGNDRLAVLHCVTRYPCDPAEVNLAVMDRIRAFFPGPVGYSDHSEGTAVPLAAVALGAQVIEKHITLERNIPNAQDWKVSCDPHTLGPFVRDIREIEAARGGGPKVVGAAEKASADWARKSLTAVRDLPAGTVLSAADLVAQRPGTGLSPDRLGDVLGRRLGRAVAAGTPLISDMLA